MPIEERWTYMQKGIHGVSKSNANANHSDISSVSSNKRKMESPNQACNQDSDETIARSSKTREGVGSANRRGGDKTNTRQGNKIPKVGIKHFSSNRILLRDQEEYFDQNYCVLIIPNMKVDEVMNWSGDGYDAIVLVADYKYSRSIKVKRNDAYEVYQRIETSSGVLRFATEGECEKSRVLLESMIRCVCKSFKETFRTYFPDDGGNSVTKSSEGETTLKEDVTKSKKKMLTRCFCEIKNTGQFSFCSKVQGLAR